MASNLFTNKHHCDIFWDKAHGGNSNYNNCQTNPGHKNFLTVAEFGMKHLLPKLRTESYMYYVKDLIDRTVNILIESTSRSRPDTYPGCEIPYPCIEIRGKNHIGRCGTGFIADTPLPTRTKGPCPCPECKKSNQPKMEYWKFTVATATHVVFDDIEAERVKVEVFYDTEDKRGVKHLYGLNVKGNSNDRYQTDACDVVCVTHDASLVNRLATTAKFDKLGLRFERKSGILISHPHGTSKKISLGKFHERTYPPEPNAKTILLEKGTRVSIPPKHGQQEHNPPSNDSSTHTPTTSTLHTTSEKNQEKSNVEDSKENVTPKSECNFCDLLTPTEETNVFELKAQIKAVPPLNSELIVSDQTDWSLRLPKTWTIFPTDTKFVSPNGSVMDIPMGTEFWMYAVDSPVNYSFLTYTMPTCPGSSGAAVFFDYPMFTHWRHFGAVGVGGANRSGHLHDWLKLHDNEDDFLFYSESRAEESFKIIDII